MQVDVVMPKMGESIQEGKIIRWAKKVGEKIAKDETILEISTDKVDSEIPSPVAGILAAIIVAEQETVPVGTVIAKVETDANASVHVTAAPALPDVAPEPSSRTSQPPLPTPSTPSVSRRNGDSDRFYSPLVRSIAQKEGVSTDELKRLAGSGISGRVTKNDLLAYLKSRGNRPVPAQRASMDFTLHHADPVALAAKYPPPRYELRAMDNVQQKMAEHMVRSVATSPHVQAIDEIDLTEIVKFRDRTAESFEKREGFKLTFTPFFFEAAIFALRDFPIVNSSVEGDVVIVKKFVNIGMAVASPSGLLVPNIKNADGMNFLGIARAINDLAVRTRNKKLKPEEIQDGTFSITNYGVFGNIIGIPIINQPQVGILGFGAIKKRPVVVTDEGGNDTVAIRSMVYATLSFDHRIIDGAIGGQFLAKVKVLLEEFDFSKVK